MSPSPIFVDTNVFVYAFDRSDTTKHARALSIIDTERDRIVVSTQVLVELHAVCTAKLGLDRAAASRIIDSVARFPVVDTDRTLVLEASALAASDQLSIFDAAIICAAIRAGCSELATEDLQTGRHFDELVVIDPFAD